MTYRIGIIGGDGIGPEVVGEAVKCVDAAGVGYERVAVRPRRGALPARRRRPPRRDLEAIRKLDAVMLGAVGTPRTSGRASSSAASCSGCASSSTST